MMTTTRDFLSATVNWQRLTWLAVHQLLDQYTRQNKLAFIMALAEPLILIMGIYVFRGVLKGHAPNYGTSLFLFYASGFLPYFLFIRVSTRTRSSQLNPGSRLPGLTALDMYIANVVLHSLLWITMLMAIFLGMWLYGIEQARPASVVNCVVPLFFLIMLGTGIGMINNVINRYFRVWNAFYAILTRGLLFVSGVIIIVDLAPPQLKDWCVANPLSHGVEWFRLGVYGQYPHNSLDRPYFMEWALIALFLGFIIDRAALRDSTENR